MHIIIVDLSGHPHPFLILYLERSRTGVSYWIRPLLIVTATDCPGLYPPASQMEATQLQGQLISPSPGYASRSFSTTRPPIKSPFEYTLISPTGQVIPILTANATPIGAPVGWEYCTAAYVPQAKGVWRIDVIPKFSYVKPTLDTWPNHVDFVMPHGRNEGILAVEFEGIEVVCPTVTTQVQLGQCNPDRTRQPSSLLLNFTPALAPGTSYNITWYTAIAPPINVTGTVPPGPSPQMISYPPNFTLYPAVSGTIIPPGGQPCSFSSTFEFPVGSSGVTIPSCP